MLAFCCLGNSRISSFPKKNFNSPALSEREAEYVACVAGARRGGEGGREKSEKSPSLFPFSPFPVSPTPFNACYAGYGICKLCLISVQIYAFNILEPLNVVTTLLSKTKLLPSTLDHPRWKTKWSLTGGGRLREKLRI